ncbi:MAG: VWA domain-containing protein [Verrucomicrobia bacterium]|nr:VWA domain-containing protein [Verrucomicrobiota bacterium]
MPTFTSQVFQNPYLPRGADEVHAIVSVQASAAEAGKAAPAGELAFGLLLDVSGSMGDDGAERLRCAKTAVVEALELLREDCHFFVVLGRERAETLVLPQRATAANRAAAIQAVRALQHGGGTRMSTWLRLAQQHFEALRESRGALICQALLLTDGKNDGQDDLEAALRHCAGVFECHARGVGVDWQVAELRLIGQRLLGTVDIVPEPALLAADFRAILGQALERAVADVRLRLWTPQGASVLYCRQVAPEILDLAPASGTTGQIRDYPTGSWAGRETRDYHFALRVKPGQLGQRMLAGKVGLVLSEAPDAPRQAEAQVLAIWTDDEERTAVIDRTVAHYTGQGELAQAIQEGLAARQAGDAEAATRKLGRAVQLAAAHGHDATTRLLRRVVDIVDEREGTVKLRREIDEADAMALDTRSTRTRRLA